MILHYHRIIRQFVKLFLSIMIASLFLHSPPSFVFIIFLYYA